MTGLKRFVRLVDSVNHGVGRAVMWLALAMALVQSGNVIMRYVFAVGSVSMQQSVLYMHALLFLLGAGFTLMHDGHVRVDVVYRTASARRRAWTDLFGALVLLLPMCVLTFTLSYSYVLNSWRVLEGSTEMRGLPLIFLLKTSIWAFALLLGLQALALAARAVLFLTGAVADYSAAVSRPAKESL